MNQILFSLEREEILFFLSNFLMNNVTGEVNERTYYVFYARHVSGVTATVHWSV